MSACVYMCGEAKGRGREAYSRITHEIRYPKPQTSSLKVILVFYTVPFCILHAFGIKDVVFSI